MDASRSNSPSRKSRFRSQSGAPYRSTAPAEETVPETEPGIPSDEEEGAYAETPPADTGTPDPSVNEPPPEESYLGGPPSAEPPPEEDHLPAGLRLTRSANSVSVQRRGLPGWGTALASLFCLGLGGLGGYLAHSPGTAAVNRASNASGATARPGPVIPLAPATVTEVDAAFDAGKQGHFDDARQRFEALADSHPGWPSMRIESARAALYAHDFDGAERILVTMQRSGNFVDAAFLLGLLEMTRQDYDKSEVAFAQAIALDPARPDIFYFWGECLRREGKPQDAAGKFHEALIRNQYETTEGLYQLKLWLSEIQSDQESAKGANAKIDADLASGHPSGQALFAAAARAIKAGQYKEAGQYITQAQKVVDPAVFRVILQDPTFLQENYRPELAPFYQP